MAKDNKTSQNEVKKKTNSSAIVVITILMITIGLYILLCLLFPKVSGVVGEFIQRILFSGFGGAAFLIPLYLMVHGLLNKRDIKSGKIKYRWIFSILVILFTGIMIHAITFPKDVLDNRQTVTELIENGTSLKGGGLISGGLGQIINGLIGPIGTYIFTGILLFIFLCLSLGITPASVGAMFRFYIKRQSEKRINKKEEKKQNFETKEKETIKEEQTNPKKERVYNNINHDDHFYDIEVDEYEEPSRNKTIYTKDMPSDDDYEEVKPKNEIKHSQNRQSRIVSSYVTPNLQNQDDDKNVYDDEDEQTKTTDLSNVFDIPEDEDLYLKYSNAKEDEDDEEEDESIKSAEAVIALPSAKEKLEEEPKKKPKPQLFQPETKYERQVKLDETVSTRKEYLFPSVELLQKPEGKHSTAKEDEETTYNANRLVEALSEHGIPTKVVGISRGPRVTRYDVELDKGVRVSALKNRVDDISYALATNGVRICGIIPGKSAIGIEVPNKTSSTVYIREMIDNDGFRNNKSPLNVALGINIPGEKVYMDISKMPHILVAGTTGSGKSVLIHNFIMSVLFKAKPDEVKFILIDPKKVEFNLYKGIPHLVVPIISDPKKAAGALHWATQEMDRRFELLEEANVRDFKSYNESIKGKKDKEKIPYLIIIIDEFADLMMQSPAEVETSVCRIAQKARAAGIHLVIGTQRPTVNVVTGLIKSNIPSRISFHVMSATDSRIIMDEIGANSLLGQGDMLYKPIGASNPERIQSAFVSEKEIEKVVKFIIDNNKNEEGYDYSIVEQIDDAAKLCDKSANKQEKSSQETQARAKDTDPLLDEAIRLTIREKSMSISTLQRRLALGFVRAAKIIDIMEAKGVIGPQEGQKPRAALITEEEYEEMLMREDTSDGEE